MFSDLFRWLPPQWLARFSAEAREELNVVVRKLGHFTGYGPLGTLWLRCLSQAGSRVASVGGWRLATRAWLVTVAWACVDEYHQSFSPSRGPSPWDVVIDGAGAMLAIGLYLLWKRSRNR